MKCTLSLGRDPHTQTDYRKDEWFNNELTSILILFCKHLLLFPKLTFPLDKLVFNITISVSKLSFPNVFIDQTTYFKMAAPGFYKVCAQSPHDSPNNHRMPKQLSLQVFIVFMYPKGLLFLKFLILSLPVFYSEDKVRTIPKKQPVLIVLIWLYEK